MDVALIDVALRLTQDTFKDIFILEQFIVVPLLVVARIVPVVMSVALRLTQDTFKDIFILEQFIVVPLLVVARIVPVVMSVALILVSDILTQDTLLDTLIPEQLSVEALVVVVLTKKLSSVPVPRILILLALNKDAFTPDPFIVPAL